MSELKFISELKNKSKSELEKLLKEVNKELSKFSEVTIEQTEREENLWTYKRKILAKLNPINYAKNIYAPICPK